GPRAQRPRRRQRRAGRATRQETARRRPPRPRWRRRMDAHRLKDAPAAGIGAAPEPDAPPPIVAPMSHLLDPRRPTWALLLLLACPTLLQQLLVFTVNLFDGLLAGRFQDVGQAEQIATQAAQTTANYLAWFLSSCTILVSVGATALVAR